MGTKIRVEAIAENSLFDEVFINTIKKLAVAAGVPPAFGRYHLAVIYIYIHKLPLGVKEGTWINFKVNTNNKTPASTDTPDVSMPFKDGVTLFGIHQKCLRPHIMNTSNESAESVVTPINMMAIKLTNSTKIPTSDASVLEDIRRVLFTNGTDTAKYSVYNVGQGHCARVFSK
ncbi:hypothetical protein BGX38DRAFT_1139730 [Terfezia claveryi]|nr:hypothetical protein BGX38DRAFT_1139730 [Terfezia claveryi]